MIADLAFHPRGWLDQQIVRGPNDTVTTDDQITTFAHDARGNLTKVTSTDGNFATLTYDGRDQLTRIDDQLQDCYAAVGTSTAEHGTAADSRRRRRTRRPVIHVTVSAPNIRSNTFAIHQRRPVCALREFA